MMMDSYNQPPLPKSNLGTFANVEFTDESVILTPQIKGLPGGLIRKIEHEKEFRTVTSYVAGLYHPKIISEDEIQGRYEIERAKGFNLTCNINEIQGGGLVDFIEIPIDIKIDALITYLETIKVANSKGYLFRDHKSDSIFIDPDSHRISIVDADAFHKADEPTEIWENENHGGKLKKVLQTFFTRDINVEGIENLIPPFIASVINSLDQIPLEDSINQIKKYRNGEQMSDFPEIKKNGSFYRLMAETIAQSEDLLAYSRSKDWANVTELERDRFEIECYKEGLAKTGEIKRMDRFLFKL